jgi:hypothetical protein
MHSTICLNLLILALAILIHSLAACKESKVKSESKPAKDNQSNDGTPIVIIKERNAVLRELNIVFEEPSVRLFQFEA